jgi:putative transposase
MSQRRVARLIPVERMTLRYEHHRDPQEALRIRLRELAGSRVRYGYRRLTVLLKREGWEVNAKRIYRLYIEEGLIVRTKKRKERAQRQRVAQGAAIRPNQKWSMDFVAQRTPDGRWIRVLTVVDQFTRECLTLCADNTLSGEKVATALDKVVALRGAPESTTGASSPARRWITGPTRTVFIWTSSALASRSITAISNRSTASCATSA